MPAKARKSQPGAAPPGKRKATYYLDSALLDRMERVVQATRPKPKQSALVEMYIEAGVSRDEKRLAEVASDAGE